MEKHTWGVGGCQKYTSLMRHQLTQCCEVTECWGSINEDNALSFSGWFRLFLWGSLVWNFYCFAGFSC